MFSGLSKLSKVGIPAVAALAMGLGIAMSPARAETFVNIGFGVTAPYAPPAPRYERRPAIPYAYRVHPDRVTWAPGHWDWRRSQYQWVPGSYVETRRGYDRRDARWDQRNDHNGRGRDHNRRDRDWR